VPDGFEESNASVEALHRWRHGAAHDPVAARDARLRLQAGQVQREALTRAALGGRRVVGMQRPHAGALAHEDDLDLVAERDRAAQRGPGDHQPGAGDGEAAIDAQAEVALRFSRGDRACGLVEVQEELA
jgi:hypothetical protein